MSHVEKLRSTLEVADVLENLQKDLQGSIPGIVGTPNVPASVLKTRLEHRRNNSSNASVSPF